MAVKAWGAVGAKLADRNAADHLLTCPRCGDLVKPGYLHCPACKAKLR